jgi:restriction system protein
MPPRNLFLSIALGGLAALSHPLALIAKIVAAAASSLRRSNRWQGDTARWTPELLKQLEWRRFVEVCAAYFEALGFRADLAHAAADGGVSINLYPQGSASAAIIVQCRPWSAYHVGIKPVRGLQGAMIAASVPEGVMVTSGKFTQEARDFAGKERISLIDGAELVAKIAALLPETALALLKYATDGDFATPTCPTCEIKMISRKSTAHGRTYWGCRNYPRCKQTFFDTANAPG